MMPLAQRQLLISGLMARDRKRRNKNLRDEGRVYADTHDRLRAENDAEAAARIRRDRVYQWSVVGCAVAVEIALAALAWAWMTGRIWQ